MYVSTPLQAPVLAQPPTTNPSRGGEGTYRSVSVADPITEVFVHLGRLVHVQKVVHSALVAASHVGVRCYSAVLRKRQQRDGTVVTDEQLERRNVVLGAEYRFLVRKEKERQLLFHVFFKMHTVIFLFSHTQRAMRVLKKCSFQ